jgi:signal transduction histidine kinase/ligand-binding sensor domain-containing protein
MVLCRRFPSNSKLAASKGSESAPDSSIGWDMHRARIARCLLWLIALGGLAPQSIALAEKQFPPKQVSPEVSDRSVASRYMIDSWQVQDGLPSQTVRAISETPDGYLWIGTSGGLARFDGSRFKTYSRQNVTALEDDSIYCLLTTRDGSLWIGTEGGGLVQFKAGVFSLYKSGDSPQSGFIRGLYEDSGHTLWVATDGGLFRVRGGDIVRADTELGIPVFNVNAVLEDHLGRLWVGGASLFMDDHGTLSQFSLDTKGNLSQVRSLLETPDGSIWAGTIGGLYRLPPREKQFRQVRGIATTVNSLQQGTDGAVWAGTFGEGIYRLVGGQVIEHLASPKTPIGNTAFTIFRDTDRNLWVGTQTGMMRVSESPVHIVEIPGGLNADFGTVFSDADGSLWAASNTLVRVQGRGIVPQHFAGVKGVRICSFLHARDRTFWIGTIGNGVYHVTASGTRHFRVANGLVNNFVRSLTEAGDGSIWIGTDNGASHLGVHGLENFTMQNGLTYYSIRAILEDRQGDVWIGTDHGLNHLRGHSFIDDAGTRALSAEPVWSLSQDSDGGIWIGTRGNGLYLYSQGRLSHFTTKTGLVSDTIYAVLEDKKKQLWLSTPAAVMFLSRDELIGRANNPSASLSMRIFPARAGGKGTQFYGGLQPSGTLTRDGEGCFPSTQGLWVIRPDQAPPARPARLNLSSISVDGQNIPAVDSLILAAVSGRLEIAFDLVPVRPQGELRFRYKLDGFDQDWIQAETGQRVATYTNIPPGQYKFEVEAWETGRPEEKERAVLRISKRHFFYQTPWFWTLCALVSIALLFLAYYLRMSQLRNRFHAILAERARIAREVHDTLLQGCACVSALLQTAAGDDAGDSESRLHLIQFASTQIRSTMDEARDAITTLRAPQSAPVDLIKSLKRLTERVGREYGVETALDLAGSSFELDQPATNALTMVVREAVFNAVLHANAQTIRVELKFAPGELAIAVVDDGKGFTPTAVLSEDHFGISGMQERIDALGGKLAIESRPGMGTRVRILLPRPRARA